MRATYDPETQGRQGAGRSQGEGDDALGSAAHAVDVTVALYDRLFTAEVPGEATGDPLDDVDPTRCKMLTGCKVEPPSPRSSPVRSCSSSASATSPLDPTNRCCSTAPSACATSGPTSRSASNPAPKPPFVTLSVTNVHHFGGTSDGSSMYQ